MARTKRSKSDNRKRQLERAKQRKTILHYLVGDASMDSWPVVRDVIDELFSRRSDVLREYVRTEGSTDWVWLEEAVSGTMDEMPDFQELRAASRDVDYTTDAYTHSESYLAYVACMMLAVSAIRAVHPRVQPPGWLHDFFLIVWGQEKAPDDIAEIVRDMFLQGKDQEALAVLGELKSDGPFILWNEGVWMPADRSYGTELQKPNQFASFTVEAERGDTFPNPQVAVGYAMRCFATFQSTVIVRGNTHLPDHPMNGMAIFAISNDATAIDELERERAT